MNNHSFDGDSLAAVPHFRNRPDAQRVVWSRESGVRSLPLTPDFRISAVNYLREVESPAGQSVAVLLGFVALARFEVPGPAEQS